MADWGDPATTTCKFVLTVKLFMLNTLLKSKDPRVQYLLFIQAVYSIISGIYPTNPEEAVKLAALQMMAKHGVHKPELHKPGFLSHQLVGYIPHLLLQRRTPSAWEADIFASHASLTITPEEAPIEYCRVLEERDYYGCATFVVTQAYSRKLPKTLLIGISCRGIYLFERDTKSTLQGYALSDIFRWGYKPETSFYFEEKRPGGAGPVYEFRTIQGHEMSDLLTDYAMALLGEMGLGGTGHAGAGAADGGAGSGSGPGEGEGSDPAASSGIDSGAAATRLQAVFRGYRLRRDLEYEYAAVRVQSVYRGYRERCKFDAMIAEMEAQLAEAEAEG